jgi:hypothetical protein
MVVDVATELGVTKEAVYKTLRNLIAREICVKRGKTISLSNQWVVDMSKKWRTVEARYIDKAKKPLLADKNSIVYTCKTLDQLDTLWNHYIIDLATILPVETPLLFYTPHYWFPAIRSSAEEQVTRAITSRGYRWMQLAGNTTTLDVELQKYFPQKEIEYHSARVNDKKNATILGDYIIEVTFDKKASEYIDEWYEKNSMFTKESIAELEKALKIKGIYKLKILRSKSKALYFRKLFAKYFVF